MQDMGFRSLLVLAKTGYDLRKDFADTLKDNVERQLPRPLRELDFADSFMGWDAAILSG